MEKFNLINTKGEVVKQVELPTGKKLPDLIEYEGKHYIRFGNEYIEQIPYVVPFKAQ